MTWHAEPVEVMRGADREVAGAVWLVLLSAAAMLGDSLRNLEHQNFGFDPNGLYLISIGSPMLANYKQEQLVPLYRQIQVRLGAIPGVRSVSAATYAPMSGNQNGHDIRIQGEPTPARRTMYPPTGPA